MSGYYLVRIFDIEYDRVPEFISDFCQYKRLLKKGYRFFFGYLCFIPGLAIRIAPKRQSDRIMVADAMPILEGVCWTVVTGTVSVVSAGTGVAGVGMGGVAVAVTGAATVSPNTRFFFIEGLDPITLYCPGLISP